MTGSILLEDRTSWQSNGEETNTRMYYVSNNILTVPTVLWRTKGQGQGQGGVPVSFLACRQSIFKAAEASDSGPLTPH